jgi:hypothetical protein
MRRVFILSPARTDGKRAALVFNERASFDLAVRLRSAEGASLGEVFSFLSGLYFRGKLAYARRFARPPETMDGCYVITSNAGLVPVDMAINLARLQDFAQVPIDLSERRYCEPLRRTARDVQSLLPARSQAVLLGSIATRKYVDLLLEPFGERLVYPREFVGRGDMSRGGLMLRAVAAGSELEYVSVAAATVRTGKRPPKLEKVKAGGKTKRTPRRTLRRTQGRPSG